MKQNDKLKRCPFCGGYAVLFEFTDRAKIQCRECFAEISRDISLGYSAIDEVISKWNRRDG